jgi:transcriptional regulator with XRE-family HTH domain
MADQGLSAYALAAIARMSERHLSDLVAGKVDRPQARTLRKLAAALRVPIAELTGSRVAAEEVVITVPFDDIDVLRMSADVARSDIGEIARRVIHEWAERRRVDPDAVMWIQALNKLRESQALWDEETIRTGSQDESVT